MPATGAVGQDYGAVVRVAVFVNEAAGTAQRASGVDLQAMLQGALAEAGATGPIAMVAPEDLAEAMVEAWAEPDRPDVLIVAGGDGTVSSAAGIAAEHAMVLGVLPMGTFNHFAKDLGLSADVGEALAATVSEGIERRVDIGEVNGQVFINNVAIGLYPIMVAQRDRITDQRGWGKLRAVPVALVRTMRALPVHRFDLEGSSGFHRERVRTPFVFVGNGAYDDESGRVGARSSLVDGSLGLYVARVVSRWGVLRTALATAFGGTQAARDLDGTQLEHVEITSRTPRVRVAVDGEVCWLETPLRFRARAGALRVLAPAVPLGSAPSDPNQAVRDQA